MENKPILRKVITHRVAYYQQNKVKEATNYKLFSFITIKSNNVFTFRKNWFFDCTCDRCSDKTEMETYLGAILCRACSEKARYYYSIPVFK